MPSNLQQTADDENVKDYKVTQKVFSTIGEPKQKLLSSQEMKKIRNVFLKMLKMEKVKKKLKTTNSSQNFKFQVLIEKNSFGENFCFCF